MILFLFHVLCYDVWFYAIHIVLHNKHIYFIHKIHHKTHYNELTYADANKGHSIEKLVTPLGIFIPFFVVEGSLFAFFCAVVYIYFRGCMQHDHNYIWLIGNHHILHHKYRRCNYGEYWIDTLCGTKCDKVDEYIYGCIYT